jgi:SAM-dependent methyltransferase
MRERLYAQFPRVASSLQRYSQYWPHAQGVDSYSLPVVPDQSTTHPSSPLPVPPREFWADYCTSVESYLASGREDCDSMRQLLIASGAPIERAERVLELGCAAGRMLRCLADLADTRQLWGTDIWASAIVWCQDHLCPPFNFATTTTVPHLPFEDRSFDLVFCGSVFTHIDERAEAWLLELHRILRPGSRLYLSLNDRHAVGLFDGEGRPEEYLRYYERAGGKQWWDHWVTHCLAQPDYNRFRRRDAYMFSMDRSRAMSHVMWDADALCKRLAYGYRRCSLTPSAYGHQTALLLERR